jgi:uncharacterized protein
MQQLALTEIWTYPIKSLGGIQLERAKIFEKGLELDRRWMLIDETNTFLTQRVFPSMALFKLSRVSDSLHIKFKDDFINFNINTKPPGKGLKAKIWNDDVDVVEADEHLSSWFSEKLQLKCRLVAFPENNPRVVDPDYKVNDGHVSLADAYPFLIIGQSSLDNLNTRLDTPVPMNRFRPNFVFTGGQPFEEDSWRQFAIGKNRFVGIKPCARCVLTTVNQDTAEKGIEPLYTLSTFRKKGSKVLFGQNLIALDHGEVSVGDKIMIS